MPKGFEYRIYCVVILFLFTISCKKFLTVHEPNSKFPTTLVFSSDENANAAVVGIYLDMYGNSGSFAGGGEGSLAWLAGLSADELHNNSTSNPLVSEFERNEIRAENPYIEQLWISMYRCLYQANSVLKGIDLSTGLTSGKKRQFKGEALFIRAFCYFYLTNTFGDVPLVVSTEYRVNAKLPKVKPQEIYHQIEADLLAADSLLPENYTTTGRVRPNRSTSSAFLARISLYLGNWQKAAEYATDVITQGRYTLPDDLNEVFLATSPEAIWQLKPDDLASITNEGNVFLRPSLIGNIITDTIIHSFAGGDKRKQSWVSPVNFNGSFIYRPYKYKLSSLSSQPTNEYSTIFRLSEQYLIRAEARAQLQQIEGENGALADINTIRARAGLSDTLASSVKGVMGIIDRERKLELFTEWGHRWLDIKRWNKTSETLSRMKPAWDINDVLYPIPQNELNKNPNLNPQNAGY